MPTYTLIQGLLPELVGSRSLGCRAEHGMGSTYIASEVLVTC